MQNKNDKQLVNNHRPICLLPIFGKIFEKIIFIGGGTIKS